MILASPRNASIRARVVTKAGIFPFAVMIPLIQPIAAPTTITASSAAKADGNPVGSALYTFAPITLRKASIEPTERSISPKMIIIVIATAQIALVLTCRMMFIRLLCCKKYGLSTENRITSSNRTKSSVNCRSLSAEKQERFFNSIYDTSHGVPY